MSKFLTLIFSFLVVGCAPPPQTKFDNYCNGEIQDLNGYVEYNFMDFQGGMKTYGIYTENDGTVSIEWYDEKRNLIKKKVCNDFERKEVK